MRTPRITSLGVVLMAAMLASVGLKSCDKKAKAAEPTPPMDRAGYVVVEEDVIGPLTDVPQEAFTNAHNRFLKNDYKAAALDVRKAAAVMRLEAARATLEGKQLLNGAIKDLDKLAMDVEKGTVKESSALKQAFAQSEYYLAQHHYLKAMECKTMEAGPKIGSALTASAMCVEHALAWSGHEATFGTSAALKNATTLGGNLMTGTGWVAKEGGMAIDAVGEEIVKLGKLIQPSKMTPKV